MELVRTVEEKDIPELQVLLVKVFGNDDYREIRRLGGMTNRTYEIIRREGQSYVVRLPGVGTESLINRLDERKSTELACRLGIDAELLYFGDDGRKVSRFIEKPQPMNEQVMMKRENLCQAAEILRRLHTCGEDTGVRFEVFEMAAVYENVIQQAEVPLYKDYGDVKKAVMEIKAALDADGALPKVPCHNDVLLGNWVLAGDGRLYLVDWEYAGMNEAMWDLSCLSIEASFSESVDAELLENYYGRVPKNREKQQFVASKTYVDYLWSLWGLTRVPYDGAFMQEYADVRYARLKRNIDYYKKEW